MGHSTTHSTKKGAQEAAARRSADGQARHDAHPQDGRGGHYHPNKTKNKGSEHHYYPKKQNPKESILWSGQFHFLVSSECDISYLQGRMGGYVSAIAVASSESEFIVAAKAALRERMLIPDEEYQNIKDISEPYRKRELSDEWIQLCKEALETRRVVFTTFDLYTSV